MKPNRRPGNPCFSSGPCAKRPGWSPAVLAGALNGRSHRSAVGLARLVEVVERSRAILGIPGDWRVGIVAGRNLWSRSRCVNAAGRRATLAGRVPWSTGRNCESTGSAAQNRRSERGNGA